MTRKNLKTIVVIVVVLLVVVFAYMRINRVVDAGKLTPEQFEKKYE